MAIGWRRMIEKMRSVTKHGSPDEHDNEPPSKVKTGVEVPLPPHHYDKPAETEKQSRQWLDNTWKVIPIALSIWAIVVSSGSRDAAQESAGSAKRSADAAEDSVVTARRSVDIAERGVKTTIENFQLAQRPWITARVELPRGITVFGSGQTNASFRIMVENIGNSVAVKVLGYATVALVSGEGVIGLRRMDEAIAQRNALCEENHRGSDIPWGGMILFPEQRDAVDAEAIIRSGPDLEEYTEFDPLTRTQVMKMMVIGCVTYQSVTSPKRHVTGFVYTLDAVDYQIGLPVGRSVPVNKLGLFPYTFAHAYID